MCKNLMPDVVVPEAYQNDRSYVCVLSGLTFDPLCKNLACMVGSYTEDLRRKYKTFKIGGGCLPAGLVSTAT